VPLATSGGGRGAPPGFIILARGFADSLDFTLETSNRSIGALCFSALEPAAILTRQKNCFAKLSHLSSKARRARSGQPMGTAFPHFAQQT
jgi:hypothetical protein